MSIRMAPQNIKTTPPNYVDAFLKSPFRLRRLRMVLALVLISSPSSMAYTQMGVKGGWAPGQRGPKKSKQRLHTSKLGASKSSPRRAPSRMGMASE